LAEDENGQPSNLGQAVSEVSERATLLIREEIELAKTEVFEKVSVLVRGAVVGIAAGIFVVVGLLFLLHAAAWGIYTALFNQVYLGYLVVAGVLFLLGGLAGFLAAKAFKKGSPPKPEMAIDEAKKIKETVRSGSEARV
jgi:predicted phage tail protein